MKNFDSTPDPLQSDLKEGFKQAHPSSWSSARKAKVREYLMSFAEKNPALSRSSFFSYLFRPALAGFGVLLTFSGISVAAAHNALPGDTFYPVKIVAQDYVRPLFMDEEEKKDYLLTRLDDSLKLASHLNEAGDLTEERTDVLQKQVEYYLLVLKDEPADVVPADLEKNPDAEVDSKSESPIATDAFSEEELEILTRHDVKVVGLILDTGDFFWIDGDPAEEDREEEDEHEDEEGRDEDDGANQDESDEDEREHHESEAHDEDERRDAETPTSLGSTGLDAKETQHEEEEAADHEEERESEQEQEGERDENENEQEQEDEQEQENEEDADQEDEQEQEDAQEQENEGDTDQENEQEQEAQR